MGAEGKKRLGKASRACSCEFFGNGTVEDALDGRACVSDGGWRVVCGFREVADELLDVVTRAASCLQDEQGTVDVWISVKHQGAWWSSLDQKRNPCEHVQPGHSPCE